VETYFAKTPRSGITTMKKRLSYLIKAFLDVAFEIWQFSSSK
jgi:hypothetical protein